MSLTEGRQFYKPFEYPWAFEAWSTQQRIHWIPEEVSLHEDIRDWKNKLTDKERSLLTQIFRFFTQADIDVQSCYMHQYTKMFKPIEIQMMLSAFSNMETIHIAAYSYLLDTIGMPETEYQAFTKYKSMCDKHEYLQTFNMDTKEGCARTMAVFGAFTEGLQLFASFAILLNFPRFNKMKGMGQIIAWSTRDETLHTLSIIRLFKTFLKENPDIDLSKLEIDLTNECRKVIELEDAFIDLAYEAGDVEGLSSQEVKDYIRYIADRRLTQLGFDPIYGLKKNPLPWMDEMLNGVEHTNFFENRVTEYSKGTTQGSWDDVFESITA